MKRQDKIFMIFLAVTTVMLIGIMTENIRSILTPQVAIIKIDVEKVKKKIEKAGLIPHEAKYWRAIK